MRVDEGGIVRVGGSAFGSGSRRRRGWPVGLPQEAEQRERIMAA
jgi:hypothetical protein